MSVFGVFAPLANREEGSSPVAEHARKGNRNESEREDDGSCGVTDSAETFGGAVADEDLIDNIIK